MLPAYSCQNKRQVLAERLLHEAEPVCNLMAVCISFAVTVMITLNLLYIKKNKIKKNVQCIQPCNRGNTKI